MLRDRSGYLCDPCSRLAGPGATLAEASETVRPEH
jgi:hypothetical protein